MTGGAFIYDKAFVGALIATAYRAGEAIMRVYETDFEVTFKADQSPVTVADLEAEAIILEDLAALAPSIPVIAEEKASSGHFPETGARFFLVDPLDGTKEFLNKRGDFTVNIALIEAGIPIFGLVYAPATEQLYVTLGRDEAVRAQIPRGAATPDLDAMIFTALRTREADQSSLIGMASRSHMTPETEGFLAAHGVRETKAIGSSLKFCLLAAGEADVYPRFGPTNEWDTAAGHAVLNAAGGCVLLTTGEPLFYGKCNANYLNPSFVAWGRAPSPMG